MALLQQTMTLPPPKESNFNMRNKHRTDIFIGMATPADVVHMVPGDIINISARAKLVTEALASPVFGQMRLQMDHFFVPYRILWDKWTDFIRQGEDQDIELPTFTVSLLDKSMVIDNNETEFLGWDESIKLARMVQPTENGDGVLSYFSSNSPELDFDEVAPFVNFPWINGYQEQHFGFLTAQPTENANEYHYRAVSSTNPLNAVNANSLINYLSLPVGYFDNLIDPSEILDESRHSLLPVLAYNKIWYEWYRNPQELSYAFYGNKEKYFIGDNDLSLSGSTVYSEVFTNEEMEQAIDYFNDGNSSFIFQHQNSDSITGSDERIRKFLFSLKKRCYKHDYLSSVLNANNYDNATAVVNVSGNQFTINQWRQALHVDKYQKRTYLGGDRYIDWIRAQFGVIDSDARLQRPQLLSSISSEVIFVDVESTASTDGANLGQLASRGISLNEMPENVSFRATEHGVYMIIVSLVPIVDDIYGVSRFDKKIDTFDYFVPALDNIDMQPVHAWEYSQSDGVMMSLTTDMYHSVVNSWIDASNEEVANNYLEADSAWQNQWRSYFDARQLAINTGVFDNAVGYLPAWTEYKTSLNRVSGNLSSSRKSWVLSRPNPYENTLSLQNYDKYTVETVEVYDSIDFDGLTGSITINTKPGLTGNKWRTGSDSIIVPAYPDNFINNVYISQYVDFRDYAYLWPDLDGRYPTNVLQMAFNKTMRRPMSKWSMPL